MISKFVKVLGVVIVMVSCGENETTSTSNVFNEPLASFNDGTAKENIMAFVSMVTDEGTEGYVEKENRIVVFDNDGTLWVEQPLPSQLYFAAAHLKQLASAGDYDWEAEMPYKAIVSDDQEAMKSFTKEDVIKIVGKAHASADVNTFGNLVNAWLDTATHPVLGRKYTDLVYKPMLELLEYLREHDFQIYIVSGGSMEFMRAWAPDVYGINKANIIGSTFKTKVDQNEDSIGLEQTEEFEFNDDHSGKVVSINKFIGQKPIMVVGNSDGDLEMMEYATTDVGYPTLMVYLNHTDAVREFEYNEKTLTGTLVQGKKVAEKNGWTIIDMKKDWTEVFVNK